eukprot:5690846-Amphidinium_carterae.1
MQSSNHDQNTVEPNRVQSGAKASMGHSLRSLVSAVVQTALPEVLLPWRGTSWHLATPKPWCQLSTEPTLNRLQQKLMLKQHLQMHPQSYNHFLAAYLCSHLLSTVHSLKCFMSLGFSKGVLKHSATISN